MYIRQIPGDACSRCEKKYKEGEAYHLDIETGNYSYCVNCFRSLDTFRPETMILHGTEHHHESAYPALNLSSTNVIKLREEKSPFYVKSTMLIGIGLPIIIILGRFFFS